MGDERGLAQQIGGRLGATDHRVGSSHRVTVAAVEGEVDISNVDQIANKLTERSNTGHGLIVDLRTISFIDSAGIALLHDLAVRLTQRLQQLIIVCPPDSRSRRVLELAGLGTHAPTLDDIQTALAALGQEGTSTRR